MNDLHSDLERELQRRLKRIERRIHEFEIKQQEALLWPKIHHEGLLLQANLYLWKKGMCVLEVSDWEDEGDLKKIELSPSLSVQDEVTLRFRKSRKLRLAIPHATRMLEKALQDRQEIERLLDQLEAIQTVEELEQWQQSFFPNPKETKQKPRIKPPVLPYREYFSRSGHPIWVGKKAKDNEILTFHLAYGNDWWAHVQGAPGSHVIVKGHKGQEMDPETLQDVLQLALIHSQAKKQGSAEVIVTQQKYVSRSGKGIKNVGKVQVSKHKLYTAKLDLPHFEKIKKQHP